VNRMS